MNSLGRQQEMTTVSRKCLEDAALDTYCRICDEVMDQRQSGQNDCPAQRMDAMLRITELCMDRLNVNKKSGKESAVFSNILWSLYSVDFDAVIEFQPINSWDSFPLFQKLNDFLINDEFSKHGSFHKKLAKLFEPRINHYVDVIANSISKLIDKWFLKEKWYKRREGCTTSTDVYWKLDVLVNFVVDLNWPEEEFRRYLSVRMENLSSETIDKICSGTFEAFNQWMERSLKSTDYVLPIEVCVMVNVILSSKARALRLKMDDGKLKLEETLETKLKEMENIIQDKLIAVLDFALERISGAHEGNLLAARSNSRFIGEDYVSFMRSCSDNLNYAVIDKAWTNQVFEKWYVNQMKKIDDWLTDRLQRNLSTYQFIYLTTIVKKLYSDFEQQGVNESRLNIYAYESIRRRMRMEAKNQPKPKPSCSTLAVTYNGYYRPPSPPPPSDTSCSVRIAPSQYTENERQRNNVFIYPQAIPVYDEL